MLIRHGKHDHNENEGPQELIKEAGRRRHVIELEDKYNEHGLPQEEHGERAEYTAKSEAVPGTVRTPLPPSNMSIAWK